MFIIKINGPLIVKVTFVLNVCHSLFALRNLCKYFIGLYGLIIDLKQKEIDEQVLSVLKDFEHSKSFKAYRERQENENIKN